MRQLPEIGGRLCMISSKLVFWTALQHFIQDFQIVRKASRSSCKPLQRQPRTSC